ncbi:MAG: threonine/serine dehydratase [Planctomycetota bacterium]|nr:threonine/serine dehydratase [Planctomycetota bacterium]
MITVKNIEEAQQQIERVVIRTPLIPLKFYERPDTWLKCENLQRGGAFKIRGAYNKISRLENPKGVVAYSSGNHAQAVALASKLLSIPSTIVMLNKSVPQKLEQTRNYGAEVILGGETSQEIKERAEAIGKERGWEIIPPFNDPEIIAGAGTVGMEILEDLPDVKSVVVPIGGGGLCAGILSAIKQAKPEVKIFGVEPEGAPAMLRSLEAGKLVTLPKTETIADGLKPVRVGELTFEITAHLIDNIVTVDDEAILEAARHLVWMEKLVVEPSGAATFAAIRSGKIALPEGPAAIVVSGGNADLGRMLGMTPK